MPLPFDPVSGVLGFLGQERANSANRREAERNRAFQAGEAQTNRQFQERMRNSEWQAAVADMQAAGINPALAYARGGASSPGGSMGGGSQAAPAGDSVSSAMQAIQMKQQREMTAATIQKTQAEGRTAEATAKLTEDRADYLLGTGELIVGGRAIRSPSKNRNLIDAEIARTVGEAARAGSMAEIAGIGGQVAKGFGQVMPAFQSIMGVAGNGAQSIADVINMLERAARMRDDAVQSAFGMSKEALHRLLTSLKRPQFKDDTLRRLN